MLMRMRHGSAILSTMEESAGIHSRFMNPIWNAIHPMAMSMNKMPILLKTRWISIDYSIVFFGLYL